MLDGLRSESFVRQFSEIRLPVALGVVGQAARRRNRAGSISSVGYDIFQWLTGEKPAFRVAVRVRAVTSGEYELPGAELGDMYRPAVFARQAAGRIKVLGTE